MTGRTAGVGGLKEYRRKRDFRKTAEPRGQKSRPRRRALRFVIQKHDATRLHFDLRLELDGAMKSWAVPKGPSRDPADKRLAVQVEDHPIEYNKFEGAIPEGEYGAGEVIVWDRGTYEPENNDVDEFCRDLENGRITFTLHGERLEGTWSLVRMGRGERNWLCIKKRDEFVKPGDDLTSQDLPSITSGRTLAEIAKKEARGQSRRQSRVQSPESRDQARGQRPEARGRAPTLARASPALTPMLATVGREVPSGDDWVFEPKYDGIRVLAFADGDAVSLITRNMADKSPQFPEIVAALRALGKRRKRPFVLDGEIVARHGKGLARFQALQHRIGQTSATTIARYVKESPAALIAFDMLVDGDDVIIDQPWTTRRRHLERLLGGTLPEGLMLGDAQVGNGETLLAKGRRAGWEGIMAKRMSSTYSPGARSRDWRKVKLEGRLELVVGGWTEPRKSRQHIGAVLLGYWDGDGFVYAGHTGGGFTRQGLEEMYKRLKPLERKTSPFAEEPATNERAHWVKPEVVVEVKFNEWTADGRLRQPIFLGIRDDKDARDVRREEQSRT